MTDMKTYAPGTFCWGELATSDPVQALAFYTAIFGWDSIDKPVGGDGAYTMVSLGGRYVGALHAQMPDPGNPAQAPHWLCYVAVGSADSAIQKATDLGGKVIAPPFDVMDVGRMALLEDPTGATFALWEAKKHLGAGVLGEPGAMCWHELATRDTGAAKAFYTGLFEWVAAEQPMGEMTYTMFMRGGEPAGGMLAMTPEMGAMPSCWSIYFAVSDCDATFASATNLNAKAVMPPTDIPGVGRAAVLTDPHGATFAIIKLAAPVA